MYGARLRYVKAADRSLARRPRDPTISVLPDVAELKEDHRAEQGEDEERDGGALAQIAPVQPPLIGEGGEEMGGVHGAAAGEDVHDVEVGEREDGGEQDEDGRRG